MKLGQVISALISCASKYDEDNGDEILLLKHICGIDINGDLIEVHFVDGNTRDIMVSKDGTKSYFPENYL